MVKILLIVGILFIVILFSIVLFLLLVIPYSFNVKYGENELNEMLQSGCKQSLLDSEEDESDV